MVVKMLLAVLCLMPSAYCAGEGTSAGMSRCIHQDAAPLRDICYLIIVMFQRWWNRFFCFFFTLHRQFVSLLGGEWPFLCDTVVQSWLGSTYSASTRGALYQCRDHSNCTAIWEGRRYGQEFETRSVGYTQKWKCAQQTDTDRLTLIDGSGILTVF